MLKLKKNAKSVIKSSVLLGLFLNTNVLWADGLSDLNRALNLLSEDSHIAGKIALTVDRTRGDEGDDDFEQKLGSIQNFVEVSERGLAITYDQKVLTELEQEFVLAAEDEKANTPTSLGLNELRTKDVTQLLSQAQRLARLLKEATLISEANVEYEGQPARELSFSVPLESIIKDQRTREYVDKFNSDYRVIIDQDGYPLASTLTYGGKGRAYIVLSLKASGKRDDKYQVVGNRLVNIESHEVNQYDSTFGKGAMEIYRSFEISDLHAVNP